MEKGKKGKKTGERKLTGKELSFCSCYIQCGKNPSEAYKLSDYKSDNMNPQVIANKAYKLLQKDYIRVMIDELDKEALKQVKKETGFGLKETVNRLIYLAQKAKKEGDQIKSLDLLMKHFGGYKEDNDQQKQEVNIPITNWVGKKNSDSEDDFDQAFNDVD